MKIFLIVFLALSFLPIFAQSEAGNFTEEKLESIKNVENQNFEQADGYYKHVLDIATAVGSIATAIAVGFLAYQIKCQRVELTVNNYAAITGFIDDSRARNSRKILYNSYLEIKRLEELYTKKEQYIELENLNEVAKYTAGIYEKVGFLLDQDKKFKELVIENHGYTIGRLWKIIEPLHIVWQDKDKTIPYEKFQKYGKICYERNSEAINKFMTGNYCSKEKMLKENFDNLINKVLD